MHGVRFRRLLALAWSVKLAPVFAKNMPLLCCALRRRFSACGRQIAAASWGEVAIPCRAARQAVAHDDAW